MLTMPSELVSVVRGRHETVRLADPETNSEYIVVPARVYEQLRGLLGTGRAPFPRRTTPAARPGGAAAGWDDPEMDVYNELDPRNSP